jgi:hypothetical protein
MKPVPERIIAKFLKEIQLQFPKALRTTDLIDLRIYNTHTGIAKAINRGGAPPSFKKSPRCLQFPTASLIEWLRLPKNQERVRGCIEARRARNE